MLHAEISLEIEEQFYDKQQRVSGLERLTCIPMKRHVVENCERDNAERKYNEESAVCDQCS
jgi:hypothetical protein